MMIAGRPDYKCSPLHLPARGWLFTNADKWKCVSTLLFDPEWAQWSDNSIAKHCGVTHSFVGKVRAEISLVSETSHAFNARAQRTYQDKYGQVRTMDTRKIGQTRAALAPVVQPTGGAFVLHAAATVPDDTPRAGHRNRWGSTSSITLKPLPSLCAQAAPTLVHTPRFSPLSPAAVSFTW